MNCRGAHSRVRALHRDRRGRLTLINRVIRGAELERANVSPFEVERGARFVHANSESVDVAVEPGSPRAAYFEEQATVRSVAQARVREGCQNLLPGARRALLAR